MRLPPIHPSVLSRSRSWPRIEHQLLWTLHKETNSQCPLLISNQPYCNWKQISTWYCFTAETVGVCIFRNVGCHEHAFRWKRGSIQWNKIVLQHQEQELSPSQTTHSKLINLLRFALKAIIWEITCWATTTIRRKNKRGWKAVLLSSESASDLSSM